MKNPFSFIFKLEHTTASHISFRLFGIKINFLKSQILKERKKIAKYYQSFDCATKIPKSTGNLRLIQDAYCGFLKTFDKICEENDLKYWIDFGTLIGAIRHKGFIPWDDDADVSMPREDYEKLIEKFLNGFENYPNLEIHFENNKKNKCFIKLCHKGSINLCLDIFPYDSYHNNLNSEEKNALSQKIESIRKRSKKFNTIEEIRTDFQKLTKEFILENKEQASQTPAIFMGIDFPHAHKNKVFDWEDIFPLKKIPFENIELYAPNNIDSVLKREFGDYMKIPKDSYPRHSNYIEIEESERKMLENYLQ
ncbi:MAG: LicD family protein [Candidatus Gastranaerophilales bacterium]|nr:LicD family protein [Candidatus Gastranaerophilales bacterium]